MVVEDICCSQGPSFCQQQVFQDRFQVEELFIYVSQVWVDSVDAQMKVVQVVGAIVYQPLDDSRTFFVLVVGEDGFGLDLALGEVLGELVDLVVVVDVFCDQFEQFVFYGQEIVHEGFDVSREVGGLIHHEVVFVVADLQLVVQEVDFCVVVGAVVGADDGRDFIQSVLDWLQVVRGVDGGLIEMF